MAKDFSLVAGLTDFLRIVDASIFFFTCSLITSKIDINPLQEVQIRNLWSAERLRLNVFYEKLMSKMEKTR